MVPTASKTSAFVPTATALEALAQPSLPDLEAMQSVHEICAIRAMTSWSKSTRQRRGKGFPKGFITQPRNFKCATCAVSKRSRRYRRSKRVKVAAAKRATQARTQHKHQQSSGTGLTASKNMVPASEQKVHKQDSDVAGESVTCDACQRIFGSTQALTSHLKESHGCPG